MKLFLRRLSHILQLLVGIVFTTVVSIVGGIVSSLVVGAVGGVFVAVAGFVRILDLPHWWATYPQSSTKPAPVSGQTYLEQARAGSPDIGVIGKLRSNGNLTDTGLGYMVQTTTTDAFGGYIVRGVGANAHIYGSGKTVSQATADFKLAFRQIALAPSSDVVN